VRSNPGLILIREGTIIKKWHHNDFPEINELNNNYFANVSGLQNKKIELLRIFVFLLTLFLGISLLTIVRNSDFNLLKK